MSALAPEPASIVTAGLLVIGDEILSGAPGQEHRLHRQYLTNIGVDLREVRVVPDIERRSSRRSAMRRRHTYLFTTGGIGPTHDDITADCVARRSG